MAVELCKVFEFVDQDRDNDVSCAVLAVFFFGLLSAGPWQNPLLRCGRRPVLQKEEQNLQMSQLGSDVPTVEANP